MLTRTLTSVLALVWAGAANAQTGSPQAAPTQQSSDVATVDDVVVTAQRRSERLIDVPISITTVSTEQLERAGPTGLESLTKVVPGVYLQRNVYGLSPTVRGIGSTLATSGGEQNVSVYVDGVYQPSATSNVFDLANISGIEVLKGPQGTLFGRNATGGALLINTLDPSFTPGGRLNLSYERFNQVRASAYGTAPLSDVLAVNGAISYRHSDGWIRDNKTGELVNEAENFIVRGKLLFQPTDRFSAVLTAAHTEFDDPTGSSSQSIRPAPAFLLPGNNSGPIATDRFHLSHNTRERIEIETDSFSAHLKGEFDFGTLNAITAYQRVDLASTNDLDGTYATIPAPITLPPPLPPLVVGALPTNQSITLETGQRVFTQEVNLTSKGDGPLSYVVGAFYFRNHSLVPFVIQSGAPVTHARVATESYAAYVDGAYKFGDLSLIAGLRYTYEDRAGKSGPGAIDPTPFTRFQDASDEQVSPRIGLRYAFSPQSNAYATYTQGFKSGNFDSTSATGPGVTAETLNAYEIGYKTSTPRFSLNAAAFYYDYKDTQVNATVSTLTSTTTQLYNVPKAEIYGLDLDGTYRFSDAFDIRAAVGYTHARYVEFPFAANYTTANIAATGFGLVFLNGSVDAAGNHMVRAPELTASVTFGYHAQLGSDTFLDVSVSPYYSSRVYFSFDNTLSQGAYTTVDANATFTFKENITVSVFGRNLSDEVYYTSQSVNALGYAGTFAMPRTYGVSLGYAF